MKPIDLLCLLLSNKPNFLPIQFSQDAVNILKSLSYWHYAGKIYEIECDDCNGDIHHFISLPHGGMGYYCPEIPELCTIDINDPKYSYACLKIDSIIKDIQYSLKVANSPLLLNKINNIKETNHIKNIGSFDFYSQKAYAILVTRYQSIQDKDDIEYFIKNQIKDNRLHHGKIGFVFCANHTKITAFEHGFYLVPLYEIAQIIRSTLHINQYAINNLMPLQHQIEISKSDIVIDVLSNLLNNGYSREQIMSNYACLFYDTYRNLYNNDDVDIRMIQRKINQILGDKK